MEKFSGKCDLKQNEIFGRFIVASRDMGQGDLLLLEKPAVAGPSWGTQECCLGCFSKPFITCPKCKSAPMCGSCSNHNQKECEFFIQHKIDNNFLCNNFNIVTPIRFICAVLTDNGKIDQNHELLQMETHSKERLGTPIWMFVQNFVVAPLMKIESIRILLNDEILLQKMCSILDVNTFELRNSNPMEINQTVIRGLFPNAALLNHSCVANTFITLDHENNLRIYTNRPVKKDEIISYNYAKLLDGTEERQKRLQEGKYFTCSCERCKSPTELNSYLSSVACLNENCSGLSDLNNGKWICEKCGVEQNSGKIQEIIQKAKQEILNNDSVGDLDRLISKYSKLLYKNHWLVIEAKQNFVAILRTRENLKHNMLVKKLKFCEEINEMIKNFEPCISRLRGISLYETFKTLNELCQVEFESDKITEEELAKKLSKCEDLLKESISNLLYEPLKSPESQLMRFAMTELRYLREGNCE